MNIKDYIKGFIKIILIISTCGFILILEIIYDEYKEEKIKNKKLEKNKQDLQQIEKLTKNYKKINKTINVKKETRIVTFKNREPFTFEVYGFCYSEYIRFDGSISKYEIVYPEKQKVGWEYTESFLKENNICPYDAIDCKVLKTEDHFVEIYELVKN